MIVINGVFSVKSVSNGGNIRYGADISVCYRGCIHAHSRCNVFWRFAVLDDGLVSFLIGCVTDEPFSWRFSGSGTVSLQTLVKAALDYCNLVFPYLVLVTKSCLGILRAVVTEKCTAYVAPNREHLSVVISLEVNTMVFQLPRKNGHWPFIWDEKLVRRIRGLQKKCSISKSSAQRICQNNTMKQTVKPAKQMGRPRKVNKGSIRVL